MDPQLPLEVLIALTAPALPSLLPVYEPLPIRPLVYMQPGQPNRFCYVHGFMRPPASYTHTAYSRDGSYDPFPIKLQKRKCPCPHE